MNILNICQIFNPLELEMQAASHWISRKQRLFSGKFCKRFWNFKIDTLLQTLPLAQKRQQTVTLKKIYGPRTVKELKYKSRLISQISQINQNQCKLLCYVTKILQVNSKYHTLVLVTISFSN